jgi:hypothetical protein
VGPGGVIVPVVLERRVGPQPHPADPGLAARHRLVEGPMGHGHPILVPIPGPAHTNIR